MSSHPLGLAPKFPEDNQADSPRSAPANPLAPVVGIEAATASSAHRSRSNHALERSAVSSPGATTVPAPKTENTVSSDDSVNGSEPPPGSHRVERRDARPIPPKPSLRIHLYRIVEPFARRVESSRIGQLIWIVTVISALAWCGWILGPGISEFRKQANRVEYRERLAHEQQLLTRRWSNEAVLAAHTRLAEAEQRVSPSYQFLSAWLTDFAENAEAHGIDVGYTFEIGQPLSGVDGVSKIPLRIELSAPYGSTTTFPTLLESMRTLLEAPWRIDVTAAVASRVGIQSVLGLRLGLLVQETLSTETTPGPEL